MIRSVFNMKKKNILMLPLLLVSAFAFTGCSKSNDSDSQKGNNNSSQLGPTRTSDQDNVTKGISLNYETLEVAVGKTVALKVTFNSDFSNKNVNWESSNTAVATVSGGVVTTLSVGETDIKATAEEGGYTATCHISTFNKEEADTYKPDTTDATIYFITEETLSNGTYDATADEYTFSLSGNYKQIYVNAPDKTIVVELNGVTITNGTNSPIYVADSGDIEISAKKSTTNTIKDTRPIFTEEEDDQGKGAIYVANGDLKLKGTGTLNITSTYYNGVHCKDDVKIQKQTLNVTAPNHGIRGNDSITIVSGTINVTCGGDGLHSDNSDISSKGNQKGNVTINGGTLAINSWGDAIQAAYNAEVEETDSATPIAITAKTNKYSSYSGDVVETSSSAFYLKLSSSTYGSGNYTYAALINGNWYKANYKGTQSSGGGPGGPGGRPGGGGSSTYYIYEIAKPSSATSFTLYRFQGSNVTSFSTDSYSAVSDVKAFNSAYDMVTISVSGSSINFGSWGNYAAGNTNSADVSAKGIKAENEIYIKSGTINIQAYDDAIHANNDGIIENGATPLGNVNISGGTLTLNASDDGIHADGILNISGGSTRVESAYEGLEANVINVTGGNTYAYATDDGMNATKGNSSPAINIYGGSLDINVPTSGDTDGIDSNGTLTITGGVVMVKGPGSASSSGSPAAAVDTDGAVTLRGGTLAIFGGCERTPTSSVTKTLCSSKTVSAGSHTISFSNGTTYTTELKNNTNGCVVYSDLGTATLS